MRQRRAWAVLPGEQSPSGGLSDGALAWQRDTPIYRGPTGDSGDAALTGAYGLVATWLPIRNIGEVVGLAYLKLTS